MANTTWYAGQRLTADALNDMWPSSVQATTASFSVPTAPSAYTAVPFTAAAPIYPSTMWLIGAPTRLVAPTEGTYVVHGGITWPGTLSTADARGEIRFNGSGTAVTTARVQTQRGSTGGMGATMSGTVIFTAAAQYIELYVNQNSGVSVVITAAFGMTRISYATT
ncbi:hypothetical protein OTB20_32240 [Streptomyces sp. H27-H1]|uniref:hypothetical protein n=1 Tax=Streptomyces sp. H27-H1 TaxID=2996461 RepID=UPI00226E7BDB|nr:hypothetical protein [Streptomyces sp. H27-H1]MCY0930779.1 hypothetical protein [Streptomyces sp. H27-H1]